MTNNLKQINSNEIKPVSKSKRLINQQSPEEYFNNDELYIGNPQFKFMIKDYRSDLLNKTNKNALLFIISALNDGAYVEFIKDPILTINHQNIKIQYEVKLTFVDRTDVIYHKDDEPIINYYSHYSSTIKGTFNAQLKDNQLKFISNNWSMLQPSVKFSQGNGSVDEMCLKLERNAKKRIKQYKNNEINAITQPFHTYMNSIGLGLINDNEYNKYNENNWCGKNELILKTYIDIINYVENYDNEKEQL